MANPDLEATAFVGKITAGVTHELQNVLAIIKESSGLMDDLMAFSEEIPAKLKDRFHQANRSIDNQVLRGVQLLRNLNGLAHSTDDSMIDIDLFETIKQLIELTHRFAKTRQITLSVEKPGTQIQIQSSCIQFQMAMFHAFECCMTALLPNGNIVISLKKISETVLIILHCDGKFKSEAKLDDAANISNWVVMTKMLILLGGTAEMNPVKDNLVLSLSDK